MKQQFISATCSQYHQQYHQAELLQIQQISSLKVNGIGNFQECISEPTHHYFLWQYQINNYKGTFLTGLCYNSSCSSTDLSYILKAFNQYIPIPADIKSVTRIVQNHNQISIIQIIFITLIILFIVLGFIATIINHYSLFKNKQNVSNISQLLSFEKSIKVLFQPTNNNERNRIMTSLRALALVMMICYNTALTLLSNPTLTQNYSKPLSKQQIYAAITYFGFDLWFFISGFTLAVELSKNWQRNHCIKYGIFILLRRIIQIWIYTILIFFYIKIILPVQGNGPLWYTFLSKQDQQNQYSISYLLLISNLLYKSCNYFLWVWNVTLQLSIYVTALFFLKLSKIKFKRALYVLGNLFIVGFAILQCLIATKDIDFQFGMIQGWIYRSPLVRGVAYLIGFNFGLFYFGFRACKNKQKLFVSKFFKFRIFRSTSIFLGLIFIGTIFYYFKQCSFMVTNQRISSLLTLALSIIFVFGIILIIFPSMIGYNGPVKSFLSGLLFNYISRLSFSAYSVSYCLTTFYVYNLSNDIQYNLIEMIVISMTIFSSCLFIGGVLCIFFEVPLYRLIQKKMKGQRKFIEFF